MAKVPDKLKQGIKDLKVARDYITPRRRWIRDSWADGPIEADNVRVCSMGALHKAAVLQGRDKAELVEGSCAFKYLSAAVQDNTSYCSVIFFNDHVAKDHAAVLAMFDKAIKKAEFDARKMRRESTAKKS